MAIKIFYQPNCPKCPKAKILGKKLEELGYKVEYINAAEKPEEAARFLLMATPSIVIEEEGKAKKIWSGFTPPIEEVKQYL
ncbi:MAG: thioredoxin family protein [Candidatus ainarchaeum sp.]|nr:thioredoxin family protein [Candidatus ainarchaeum sp.]